jgi:hypothetical protein
MDFDGDGNSDLSHWAKAEFLSVWEGDVFTQLQAIHRQRPVKDKADIQLSKAYVEWRGLLSSTGKLEGNYSDGQTFPEMSTRIFWCSTLPPEPAWIVAYKNGLNGEPLAGSKEALFAAIRGGQEVRIAWGLGFDHQGKAHSVEHLIEPVFMTIIDGTHVVAQLPEHIAQRSYWDVDGAFFDDAAVMWRGLMTTKGTFDAAWVNRGTGEVVRRMPQRAMLTWYVLQKPSLSTPSLAVKEGVTFDKSREAERLPQ